MSLVVPNTNGYFADAVTKSPFRAQNGNALLLVNSTCGEVATYKETSFSPISDSNYIVRISKFLTWIVFVKLCMAYILWSSLDNEIVQIFSLYFFEHFLSLWRVLGSVFATRIIPRFPSDKFRMHLMKSY